VARLLFSKIQSAPRETLIGAFVRVRQKSFSSYVKRVPSLSQCAAARPVIDVAGTDRWVYRAQSRVPVLARSGSAAFVAMMETPNLRDRDNPASFGRLHRARLRTVLLERQMRAGPVVVIAKRAQVMAQAALVHYDHVIQTLAANGAYQAFDIRALPWRSRGR
jgi:hypothetical protein